MWQFDQIPNTIHMHRVHLIVHGFFPRSELRTMNCFLISDWIRNIITIILMLLQINHVIIWNNRPTNPLWSSQRNPINNSIINRNARFHLITMLSLISGWLLDNRNIHIWNMRRGKGIITCSSLKGISRGTKLGSTLTSSSKYTALSDSMILVVWDGQ